jgi:hypothetical protein
MVIMPQVGGSVNQYNTENNTSFSNNIVESSVINSALTNTCNSWIYPNPNTKGTLSYVYQVFYLPWNKDVVMIVYDFTSSKFCGVYKFISGSNTPTQYNISADKLTYTPDADPKNDSYIDSNKVVYQITKYTKFDTNTKTIQIYDNTNALKTSSQVSGDVVCVTDGTGGNVIVAVPFPNNKTLVCVLCPDSSDQTLMTIRAVVRFDPSITDGVIKGCSINSPGATKTPSSTSGGSGSGGTCPDLSNYVLKSQIVPPVCPACPPVYNNVSCPNCGADHGTDTSANNTNQGGTLAAIISKAYQEQVQQDRNNNSMNGFGGVMNNLIDKTSSGIGSLGLGAGLAVGGLGAAVADIAHTAGSTVTGLASGVENTATGLASGAENAAINIAGTAGNTVTGLATGFDNTALGLANTAGNTVTGLATGFDNTALGLANTAGNTVTGLATGFDNTALGLANTASNTATGLATGLENTSTNLAGTASNTALGLASGLENTTTTLATTASNTATGLATGLENTSTNLANTASNTATNLANTASNTATNLAGTASGTALGLANTAGNTATNLAGTASGTALGLANTAGKTATNLATGLEQTTLGLGSEAAYLGGKAMNTVGGLANNVVNTVDDMGTKTLNSVDKIGNYSPIVTGNQGGNGVGGQYNLQGAGGQYNLQGAGGQYAPQGAGGQYAPQGAGGQYAPQGAGGQYASNGMAMQRQQPGTGYYQTNGWAVPNASKHGGYITTGTPGFNERYGALPPRPTSNFMPVTADFSKFGR